MKEKIEIRQEELKTEIEQLEFLKGLFERYEFEPRKVKFGAKSIYINAQSYVEYTYLMNKVFKMGFKKTIEPSIDVYTNEISYTTVYEYPNLDISVYLNIRFLKEEFPTKLLPSKECKFVKREIKYEYEVLECPTNKEV